MKLAKEKVWATEDGKLVADGDPKAAILVAIPGQPVPEDRLKDYSNAGSFFKDAKFDQSTGELINDVKTESANGPAPQNREAESGPAATRTVTAAKKTAAKKSGK